MKIRENLTLHKLKNFDSTSPLLLLVTYLLGIGIVVVASWWKYYSTQSLKVDDNPIKSWELYPILLMYFFGVSINIWAYTNLVFSKVGFNRAFVKRTAYLSVVLSSFMFPMLSNDVFYYFTYGDLFNQGYITYVHSHFMEYSHFLEYASSNLHHGPNHYGPFLLYLFGEHKKPWGKFKKLEN